ncbi:MAG: carboxypeptidase-like regulatory domain-containing protein [Candidatus Symbiothrix sp.]|jgi:hypothetical protein|nr:carboxypeptidase-like regulatory domain-containing protein [Candidatus Symbiothrix sp.]
MKKDLFFFFLLAISFESFSQSLISGRVVDSETKEPVESVYIQNRNRPENSALSDENGFFSIVTILSDTLDFYRVSYIFDSYVCKEDKFIYMGLEPKENNLPEIIITYEKANRILQKAIYNLKANYVHRPLIYLWHGIEKDKKNKDSKESYALYSAELGKMNPHKNEMPFDFRLIELNHLINDVQTSKILEEEQFPMLFHSIPTTLESVVKFDNVFKINNDNDSLIFIKAVSEQSNTTYGSVEFIVNKSDTVLLCINFNIVNKGKREYTKAKFLGIVLWELALEEMNVSVLIGKKGNAYYFDKIKSKYLFSFIVDKKEELIEFENTAIFLNDSKINTKKGYKKLKGYTTQLYKSEATTTNRFWEKFFK